MTIRKLTKSLNRGLLVETTSAWNRKIPAASSEIIINETLSLLSACLGDSVGDEVKEAVERTVQTSSLEPLIRARSTLSDPTKYGSAESYFASSVLLSLFAKTNRPIPSFNPRATAVDRFHEAERLCRITNKRFAHYRTFDFSNRPLMKRLDVHEIFHLARRKIADWLGTVEECEERMVPKHGPGGVIGLRRPFTTAYYKFSSKNYSCSPGVYWRSIKHMTTSQAWRRALETEHLARQGCYTYRPLTSPELVRTIDEKITITDYNKVTFVPKDAKTLRAISIEPSLNVMFQLGVGTYLKSKLQHVGCDLRDQTRNQHLAYVGSLQSDPYDPVTLDLRMASDTLSIEVVRELLPHEWFEFLDGLRSRNGNLDGQTHKWEKFSSMGNGFTFELESMIFYALAQACSDHKGTTQWFSDTFGPAYKYAYVSVFGDDIIVPQNVAGSLVEILNFCGFRLNLEKSFLSGPFRESCGEDFWEGEKVRPLFYDRGLTRVRDVISLHNGLKFLDGYFGFRFAPVLEFLRKCLPTCIEVHLRGSEPTRSDAYIWVTPDEVHLSKLVLWSTDWQRWRLPYIRWSNPTYRGAVHFRYVQFLYQNTDRGPDIPEDYVRLSNPDASPVNTGGSASEVTQSGVGKPTLGWW